MELVGQSQGTFSDMLTELGLSAAMRPQAEYTLLAPLNTAFNGEQTFLKTCQSLFLIILLLKLTFIVSLP